MGQVGTGQDMTVQDRSKQVRARQDRIGQNKRGYVRKVRTGHVSHSHNNLKPASKRLGFDLIIISLLEI